MNPRVLFLFSATAPLVLALCTVAVAVHYQTNGLEKKQVQIIKDAYLSARNTELKNYVALAQRAIDPLYKTGRTDETIKNEARTILNRLMYAKDGYFFVYDTAGILLVEPNRPALVGTNRWNHTDKNGKTHIQNFIRTAQKVGYGFEDYQTEKPSTKDTAPKRAYVVFLPKWNWVLGTGLYMDDVNDVLEGVGKQVGKNYADMMAWIGGIAFFGTAIIVILGFILNLRERHSAQEAERRRFAHELHDGICNELLVIKWNIESGKEMVAALPDTRVMSPIQDQFENIEQKLNKLIDEIKGIAHSLFPTSLQHLGLSSTLRQLVSSIDNTNTYIVFSSHGLVDDVIEDATRFALYRVTQEALNNAIKHSRAERATVRLENNDIYTRVTISDNGIGFDSCELRTVSQGMGLRNMKERVEELGGTLEIQSSNEGTTIVVTIFRRPQR